MIIELNNLKNQTLHVIRSIPMGCGYKPMEGCSYAGPVDVDFILMGKEQRFEISGKFSAKLMLTCHRCLKNFSLELDEDLELIFVPREEMAKSDEIELAREDMNIASYVDRIDLRQVIDEQVMLALPMKIVCRDECKGLCTECGKNLNEQECDCTTDIIDPRWTVLKEIRKIMNGDSNN